MMKAKHLLYLLGIYVATFFLALILEGVYGGSISEVSKRVGQSVFPKLQEAREKGDQAYAQTVSDLFNSVAKVEIRSPEQAVHLEVKDDAWIVSERNGYAADVRKLAELMRTLADLTVVQHFPEVGPSQMGRLKLIPPSEEGDAANTANTITLSDDKGKEVLALAIGQESKKQEQNPQFGSFDSTVGRYVRAPNGEGVYLVGETFNDLKADPADWLNESFFRVSKIKSIERVAADAAENWKLTRTEEMGDFTLESPKEGEVLDTTKVASMKSAFGSPSFEDVIVEEGAEKPSKVTFNVETFDGFRYVLKFNEKSDANEYLMTVDVSADLPKSRPEVKDEKEEDKKARDEEFAKQLQEMQKKLENEKKLAGHVYRVRGFVADSVNKGRSELMKDENAETPAMPPGAPGSNGLPNLPGLQGLPGFGGNQ